MTSISKALISELDDHDLDQLADLLADRLRARLDIQGGNGDRWLNSDQAAEMLGCSRARIHDLVQLQKLTPARDGRLLRFKASELQNYLEATR